MSTRILSMVGATTLAVLSLTATASPFMCPSTLSCNSLEKCVKMSHHSTSARFTAATMVKGNTFSSLNCEYGRMGMGFSSNGWTDGKQSVISPNDMHHWRQVAKWKYNCHGRKCFGVKYLCVSSNPQDCALTSS